MQATLPQTMPDNREEFYANPITLSNGETLHFVFEKLDEENIDYWDKYADLALLIADSCKEFCAAVKKNEPPSYPNPLSSSLGFDEKRYQETIPFIQKKGFADKHLFYGVRNDIVGMKQVICYSDQNESIYMVYASTVPIHNSHTNERPEINEYAKAYGKIVMSYISVIPSNTPTLTHYGIFRNPLHFLDVEEKYKGIAMQLHGFGARVAMDRFPEKKYMVTTPLRSMRNILIRSLGKGDLHVGTNLDLKREDKTEEETSLLEEYPPLFHFDKKTNAQKIAQEGTDLSQYLDHLPDEKAQFVAPPKVYLDRSGRTKEMKTMMKLKKLAEFYHET